MSKKDKHKLIGGGYALGILVWGQQIADRQYGGIFLGFGLLMAPWICWLVFRRKAPCNVAKVGGKPCPYSATGMIMGCHRGQHWLAKPMARIGLGGAWTIGSQSPSTSGGGVVTASPTVLDRADLIFWATMIGTIATVMSTVLGAVALMK